MTNIPTFREVYTNELDEKEGVTHVKTVCEIISMEDSPDGKIKKDEKLSFGISRTKGDKYNEQLGKKVSYAMAMRFMFMRISGEKHVEDRTSFRRSTPPSA